MQGAFQPYKQECAFPKELSVERWTDRQTGVREGGTTKGGSILGDSAEDWGFGLLTASLPLTLDKSFNPLGLLLSHL